MRHVDHAHDAEGDGKADGGEQQDRAERKAVPGILHRIPDGETVLNGRDGVGRSLLHRRCRAGWQTREHPHRVLIAALTNRGYGVDLVGIVGVIAKQHDGRARLRQRPLDPCVLLLADGGFERRQCARLVRLEHRLRRIEPLARIARQQRQPAERRVDGSSQPIVDADVIDVRRRIAADWRPGGGVEELVRLVLDVDGLALGAEQQAAILERADDGFGPRAAPRRNFVDASVGLAEVVGGEMGESLFEALAARAVVPATQRLKANSKATRQARQKYIPKFPALVRRGGRCRLPAILHSVCRRHRYEEPPPHFFVTTL